MIGVTYGPPRRPKLSTCVARSDKRHWVTADGRRLRVTDMEVPHLVNTVRMLKRAAFRSSLHRMVELAAAATSLSGEAAVDAINAEMHAELRETDDQFLLREVPPYAAMLRRLRRLRIDLETYVDPRPRRPRHAIEASAPDPLDEPYDWDGYGRGQDERGHLG